MQQGHPLLVQVVQRRMVQPGAVTSATSDEMAIGPATRKFRDLGISRPGVSSKGTCPLLNCRQNLGCPFTGGRELALYGGEWR
jgi:hypothetical protein